MKVNDDSDHLTIPHLYHSLTFDNAYAVQVQTLSRYFLGVAVTPPPVSCPLPCMQSPALVSYRHCDWNSLSAVVGWQFCFLFRLLLMQNKETSTLSAFCRDVASSFACMYPLVAPSCSVLIFGRAALPVFTVSMHYPICFLFSMCSI